MLFISCTMVFFTYYIEKEVHLDAAKLLIQFDCFVNISTTSMLRWRGGTLTSRPAFYYSIFSFTPKYMTLLLSVASYGLHKTLNNKGVNTVA